MNAIKKRLDLLESKLGALIERSAARLFPSGAFPGDLAYQLVEAMRSGLENAPDGETMVPSLFILHMQPEQARMFSSNPAALGGLTSFIVQAGLEAGLAFRTQPLIRIYPDPQVGPGMVQVRTQDPAGNLTQTAAMEVKDNRRAGQPEVIGSFRATLIVDGVRRFRMDGVITNIGRQDDNHLVIDDRRVSRRHAQVRLLRGRHMIFDLDSSGGTWVNGQRINQRLLAPGDLISLAGVPIVYLQDDSWNGRTETQDLDAGVKG